MAVDGDNGRVEIKREESLLGDVVFDTSEDDDDHILDTSLVKGILGASMSMDGSKIALNDVDGVGTTRGGTRKQTISTQSSFSDSVTSSIGSMDDMKERNELLEKVGRLKEKLKKAEIDMSAEKTMRRKKERNVVKLAKELNKRAKDQTQKEKQLNEVRSADRYDCFEQKKWLTIILHTTQFKMKSTDLESKLKATQNDIEARIAANERKTQQYNNDLNLVHQKYRDAVSEADKRAAETSKKHTIEVTDIRRQAKDATIELERLRTQLAETKKAVKNRDSENAKVANDYEKQLKEWKLKQKKSVEEYEARIDDLLKKQTQQTDELRKQIFETNLECDQLKTKVVALEMKNKSPEDQKNITNRAIALYDDPTRVAKKRGSVLPFMLTVVFVVSAPILFVCPCSQNTIGLP